MLFVQHAANLTGSTFSGAQICRAMVAAGWDVHVALGYEGPARAMYESIGCSQQVVEHKNWLSCPTFRVQLRRSVGEAKATRAFAHLIDSLQPELVYVNSLVSVSAMIAAKARHVRAIWHLRELFNDLGGEMVAPPLGGRALVRSLVRTLPYRVVCPSRVVAENILGNSAAATNVTVIPNAVDAGYFTDAPDKAACRAEYGLSNDAVVIGVPGTLRQGKGHLFFLEAFAELAPTRPMLHAIISGEDSDREYVNEVRGAVARLDLVNRIHFAGAVDDMRRLYAACDVSCVPSRSESFGRTVVESMAMRLPTVATAVGGICEIVDAGETALLVPYNDVPRLEAALTSVLDDAGMRQRLSQAAGRVARERFDESAFARRIVSLVEESLPCPIAAEAMHGRRDGVVAS